MTNQDQQILIWRSDQLFGPYSLAEAKRHYLSGNIVATDTAKVDGGEWLPVLDVLGIAPPPPKPVPLPKPIPPPPKPAATTPSPATWPALATDEQASSLGIDSLEVSEKWKQRFRLIEKIGWHKGVWKNYWNFKQLPLGQRFSLFFNIWGFLFGPIYYFAKGMWVKALFLIGLYVLLNIVLALLDVDINVFQFAIPVYCASMANYDFYMLKVKGKQWDNNLRDCLL